MIYNRASFWNTGGLWITLPRKLLMRADQNHQSARAYPQHVETYLDKELRCGALMGPCNSAGLQISPLMSREKRNGPLVARWNTKGYLSRRTFQVKRHGTWRSDAFWSYIVTHSVDKSPVSQALVEYQLTLNDNEHYIYNIFILATCLHMSYVTILYFSLSLSVLAFFIIYQHTTYFFGILINYSHILYTCKRMFICLSQDTVISSNL